MGRPKFTSKSALPLQQSPLAFNTPIPRPTPLTMHPKRHPDPISRFATIHTQTDRWRQARTMSASLAMVIESDALMIARNPEVIWEQPRRKPSQHGTTTRQSPHWLQWDASHLPPELPLPLRRSPPQSNIPIHRLTPLTTQTVSRSNQPFCHNALSGQTYRPTHRISDRSIPKAAYALLSDAANNRRITWDLGHRLEERMLPSGGR